jgi:hypothetical protein
MAPAAAEHREGVRNACPLVHEITHEQLAALARGAGS